MCWELDLHTCSCGSEIHLNHWVVIHIQPFLGSPIILINNSEYYQEGKNNHSFPKKVKI